MIMLLVSAGLLAVYNFFYFTKSSITVLKGYNWFINAIIAAPVVLYHFPMGVILIVFIFPLLLNVVPIFGWRKQEKIGLGEKAFSLVSFFSLFALITMFLLGSIILKEDFAISQLKEMFHLAMRDTSCTGSNLYTYFCMILVPNALTII
jgi:hypothetical protein